MPGNPPIRVALVSLGCPKNLVDSEKILAHLAEGGCVVGAPMDEADVIVVNTCGFIAPARDESLAVIAEAVACKRSGQARRVVVAGCLVNREGRALLKTAPGIDAVVGVNDREAILDAVTGRRRVVRCSPAAPGVAPDSGRFRLTPRHTAYLRISEGCSRRCTFCTIPAIRGPFRSKPPDDVLAEARELVADGAVELNVIGQDTTGYGRDLGRGVRLAPLLRSIAALDGVQWVRLLYAYPVGFTGELVEALSAGGKVVPYVDLPLQHVSEAVLRRMGRPVRRERIERLLGELRRRATGMRIRTTFIVGFPGETDRQFDELLSFLRDQRFDAMGVFPYYPEPGTPAAAMAGQLPDDVKAHRVETLMLAQQAIAFQAAEAMIGSTLRVLVDGTDAEDNCVGRYFGQAPDIDSICRLTVARPAGGFVDCTVIGRREYDLVVAPARDEKA